MSLSFVVFDCDGTLVDSLHGIASAMTQTFEAHGHVAPSHAQIQSIIGISLEPAIARLMPDHGADVHGVLAESYREHFTAMRQTGDIPEVLYPGAREAVGRLAATDALLGVATGKSRRGAERVLETHGLREHFISIRTADDGPGKPHPHMLQLAMGDCGAEPHETVMIGDTTYDIEMARAAGAGAIGVSWGYHEAEALHEAGAHVVIDGFGDLDAAIADTLGLLGRTGAGR